jgi:hypothetical protein
MKISFENKYQRIVAIIVFIAIVMSLSALLTSCSSPRYGCFSSQKMVGYGPGGWGKGQQK